MHIQGFKLSFAIRGQRAEYRRWSHAGRHLRRWQRLQAATVRR
jgi:hypothetical protein